LKKNKTNQYHDKKRGEKCQTKATKKINKHKEKYNDDKQNKQKGSMKPSRKKKS